MIYKFIILNEGKKKKIVDLNKKIKIIHKNKNLNKKIKIIHNLNFHNLNFLFKLYKKIYNFGKD